MIKSNKTKETTEKQKREIEEIYKSGIQEKYSKDSLDMPIIKI